MSFQNHEKLKNEDLTNTQYGFFTTEQGSSKGAYVIGDDSTRNVNLYSVDQNPESMFYDPPDSISGNILACIKELQGVRSQTDLSFFMTTSYAEEGFAKIVTLNESTLDEVVNHCIASLPSLKVNEQLAKYLQQENVHLIKADAVVFNYIPDKRILVGGASADAHPIILIDDHNQVCSYIAGSHKGLHAKVYEQAIEKMIELGADKKHIHTLIGPGLGPHSYEFGTKARACNGDLISTQEYFNIQNNAQNILKEVIDEKKETKLLIDLEALIVHKAEMLGLEREHVHNLGIDTLGYDAYDPITLNKRTEIDMEALSKESFLFFGARRTIKFRSQNIAAENPGIHNTVARHFACVSLKR